MYSLGTAFITTDSLVGLQPSPSTFTYEGAFLTSPCIFAAPVTIQLNYICALCDNPFEVANIKTRELKQLEDIALEYFKRRVLRAEEESFVDASEVFPDDKDGTRFRKLLSSITLCDECIYQCARKEEGILRDQLNYLEKMTGDKKLKEVFSDPLLDLKRFAFYKLKCQEFTIKEKLELMEKLFASGLPTTSNENVHQNGLSVSSSAAQVIASSSTPTNENSNMVQQIFPAISQSGSTATAVSKQLEEFSKPSSFGSPKQDDGKNNLSNESTFKETDDNIGVATSDQFQNQNQDELIGANKPSSSDVIKEKVKNQKKAEKPDEEEEGGNISDAESAVCKRSIQTFIPAIHQSPIVRIKPLSPSKTQQLLSKQKNLRLM